MEKNKEKTYPSVIPIGTKVEGGLSSLDWRALLPNYLKGLRGLGIRNLAVSSYRLLGGQSQGIALDVGNDQVLKITLDEREALAGAKLAGKRLTWVCTIYGVVKIKGKPLYLILQEKLKKLVPMMSKRFDLAIGRTNINIILSKTSDYKRAKEMVYKDRLQEIMFHLYPNGYNKDDYKKIRAMLDDDFDIIENSFNVPEIFEELKSNGVIYNDFHSGNMMQRPNGMIVAIDLGYSYTINPTGHKRIWEVKNS